MTAPIPPLSAIRVFEAVCRHLNFTRAGNELGMTQAAVSYQIKSLEEKLGYALFLRKGRKIELTEMGKTLSHPVETAFDLLRDTFIDASNDSATQLTITANSTFAMNWLGRRIGKFQASFPEFSLRIINIDSSATRSTSLEDYLATDILIAACFRPPADWFCHDLVPLNFTPMLSPQLAASVGGIDTPLDLLKVILIDPADPWWKLWFCEAGYPEIDLSGMPGSRMGSQALEAQRAISGQGAAILTPFFHSDAIDQGLLIQPFDLVSSLPHGAWSISYPPIQKSSRKIRVFRDWLFEELRADGCDLAATPLMQTEKQRLEVS
ncbi:MAG: LysR family transcriptional regulator [Rhodobacteraceae bacterium]|nr:LysR family transcriptional regulator [Paracoccaceae bacterium]